MLSLVYRGVNGYYLYHVVKIRFWLPLNELRGGSSRWAIMVKCRNLSWKGEWNDYTIQAISYGLCCRFIIFFLFVCQSKASKTRASFCLGKAPYETWWYFCAGTLEIRGTCQKGESLGSWSLWTTGTLDTWPLAIDLNKMTLDIKWFPPSWFQIKRKDKIIYIDPAYLNYWI